MDVRHEGASCAGFPPRTLHRLKEIYGEHLPRLGTRIDMGNANVVGSAGKYMGWEFLCSDDHDYLDV